MSMSKGPPYGDYAALDLPGQTLSLFDRDVYFQDTDFTCGPACLMMAMAALDENFTPCPVQELLIWREASLIMQGEGPAGCGPFGLARAALRRGYSVDIYEHNAANIIVEMSRRPDELAVLKTITRHDRVNALAEGCVLHDTLVTRDLMADLLAAGKQLIVLTFAHHDGHWVIVHDVQGDNIAIIDPNLASPDELAVSPYYTDTGRNFITTLDIPEWMHHGHKQSSVLLAIGRKD